MYSSSATFRFFEQLAKDMHALGFYLLGETS